jgi:hypothetical protein
MPASALPVADVQSAGWVKAGAVWKLALLALLAGVSICWVFATPIFGTSDETAQVMKAASVARGQLVGTADGGPNTVVQVPQDLIGPVRVPCFALKPTISAGCQPSFGSNNTLVSEETWVGYYPPLYYLLVGWPSLFLHTGSALYSMRVLSALLGAVFLALAFFSAAEARGRSLLLPATAALATPYLFVYNAAVNPGGLEMASALCAWTSGLALVDNPGEPIRRRVLVRFVLAMAVLAQVRDFGPIFVGVIALCLAGWYGYRSSWALLSNPRNRVIALVIAVCAVFAACWVLFVGNLSFSPSTHQLAPHSGLFSTLQKSSRRFLFNVRQLVGNFGWTDTYPPQWVSALGLGVMGLMLVIGAAAAKARQRIITALLLVFAVAFPIALIAREASREGILGQGRYWFPLLAGVVLLAAAAGGARLAPNRLLWTGVAVSAIVINVICFQVALDRFRFGLGQPETHAGWNPPGGADLWPILYAVLTVALVWTWWSQYGNSPDGVAPEEIPAEADVLKPVGAS